MERVKLLKNMSSVLMKIPEYTWVIPIRFKGRFRIEAPLIFVNIPI